MTPLRRQYLQLKNQHPDAILFFRLGDFYETFDDDAEQTASLLQITLTSREMGRGNRVRMAGVPAHAADNYIARLVAAGERVAVCEQVGSTVMTTSSDSKKAGRNLTSMMDRKVVRVITPGTIADPEMLAATRNNYLCAVNANGHQAGLAYADVSTGEFAATQFNGDQWRTELREELHRIQPAEVLIPKKETGSVDLPDWWQMIETGGGLQTSLITPCEDWTFDITTATNELQSRYQAASLEGFGLSRQPLAVSAAGALVVYLEKTHGQLLASLAEVISYTPGLYVSLDTFTRRNLEILDSADRTGSQDSPPTLVSVIDRTRTPLGARLLRRWLNQPLRDIAQLRQRHDVVASLVHDRQLQEKLVRGLRPVADLERLTNRVVQRSLEPRGLAAIHTSLRASESLRASVLVAGDDHLKQLFSGIDPCPEVATLIERAIILDDRGSGNGKVVGPAGQGRLIKTGFNLELDELVANTVQARQWIASLEEVERARTGIKSLKVGYNKVFGYYLQVSKAYLGSVPPEYVRRQTLTDGERYITTELKEYEARILTSQERIAHLESDIYTRVLIEIGGYRQRLKCCAEALAQIDVLLNFSELAVQRRYVRPTLAESTELDIIAGRHPVVEAALERGVADDEPLLTGASNFVPNDCRLDTRDRQIILLTGPNMAGKSTYLRMVALITLLAQVGSFVPAERAHVGLVDRIFTRVGAQDDLTTGRSTFMVEMLETATILRHATPQSLILLDEVGRGTSTYDGLAIAQAVVEHLHNHPGTRARTLFATHYHELTALELSLPGVYTARMDVRELGDEVVFLHRVVAGSADRSYGIQVARLAGIPRAVIRRAEEVLNGLEKGKRRKLESDSSSDPTQLSLFTSPHPAVDELKQLDVFAMTPLEALTKLHELQQSLRNDEL